MAQVVRCLEVSDLRKRGWFFAGLLMLAGCYLLVKAFYIYDTTPSGASTNPALTDLHPVPVAVGTESPEESTISSAAKVRIIESSGFSWVRVRFNVSDTGEVSQILVIESCRKQSEIDHCADDSAHDRYAINVIRDNRYDQPGPMEEIIFIPKRYVVD